MGGAVVLPTWMLLLDDWNEVRMDKLSVFCKIAYILKPLERIIDYQHIQTISKPFNF